MPQVLSIAPILLEEHYLPQDCHLYHDLEQEVEAEDQEF